MNKKKEKFYYISETNIPSKSANSIHVAKMIDAAAYINLNSNLIVPFCSSKEKYKKFYNIRNKVNIISIFKKKRELNFFYRLIYAFKILNLLKKSNNPKIISRSILTSLILSYNRIKNVVEIHHQLKGMTNLFFEYMKTKNFYNCQRFILLHKNLKKILNLISKNILILDDAVNLRDFKIKKKIKKKKNTIVYIGSFYAGKGLEIIYSIAKKTSEFKFDLFGDVENLNISNFKHKNLNFYGHISYNKIPELLNKYEYAIMPYGKKVNVRSSNLDVSNTMSPLKMFDYLASKKIIFASNLNVYKHILKNNYNCVLIKNNSVNDWIKIIRKTKNNTILKRKLRVNAFKTAKKYSWDTRIKLIKQRLF